MRPQRVSTVHWSVRWKLLLCQRCIQLCAMQALLLAFVSSVLGRPPQFRQISVPVSSLNPAVTLHPVDLWGDARSEFVLSQASGSLEIFGWDGEKIVSEQKLQLPTGKSGTVFYSFARLAKDAKHTLIFYTSEGLFQWPVANDRFAEQPQKLLDVQLAPADSPTPACTYYELAYDLDGDGIDELLVPQADRFVIFRAKSPLKYSAVELPRNPYKYSATFEFRKQLPDDPARISSVSGLVVRRRGVDDLVFFDANGDGREDLVYTSIIPAPKSREIERYEIYFQKPGFTFSRVPDQVIDIPYDERAYVTFRDFDKDGRCEAFVVTSNYDIVAPRTLIRVLGGDTSRTTSSRERFRLVTKDPIGLVKLADFNRDGYEDFACTFFSYQFASTEDIASLVAANRVRFKLQFFLAQPQKLFAKQPSYEFELNLSLKPESYGAYPPFYFVDDMNGDQVPDLVARADETRVSIYFSRDKLAYPKQPDFSFQVPSDAALSFADCNADGRQDIIATSVQKQSVSIYLAPTDKGK